MTSPTTSPACARAGIHAWKPSKDGKAVDADLLSGCTIRVDQYRDAVAKACTNAAALGAAKATG